MGQPKRLDIGTDKSGIAIEFVKRTQTFNIHGWFDHFVGIEGATIGLGDFLNGLGITLKMCEKAMRGDDESRRIF